MSPLEGAVVSQGDLSITTQKDICAIFDRIQISGCIVDHSQSQGMNGDALVDVVVSSHPKTGLDVIAQFISHKVFVLCY